MRQNYWRRAARAASAAVSFDVLAVASVATCAVVVVADAYSTGREHLRSSVFSHLTAYGPSTLTLRDVDLRQLETSGYVVVDGVLSAADLASVDVDLLALAADGRMVANANADATVRTDVSCFMLQADRDGVLQQRLHHPAASRIAPGDSGMPASGAVDAASTTATTVAATIAVAAPGEGLLHVQRILRGLAHALQERHFRGFGVGLGATAACAPLSTPDAVQVAVYEPTGAGAFYVKHTDGGDEGHGLCDVGLLPYLRSASCRRRTVTTILYLNSGAGWAAADGGYLRLYLADGAVLDVAPLGGRLLIFDSKTLAHEVLPTKRRRTAATVWFTS